MIIIITAMEFCGVKLCIILENKKIKHSLYVNMSFL